MYTSARMKIPHWLSVPVTANQWFSPLPREMHKTGYPFYLADNGVWLTPHVPIKYLSQKNRLTGLCVKTCCMPRDMIRDKTRNEVIAVIITGMHTDGVRDIVCFAGGFQ